MMVTHTLRIAVPNITSPNRLSACWFTTIRVCKSDEFTSPKIFKETSGKGFIIFSSRNTETKIRATKNIPSHISPFEEIKQIEPDSGAEFWSSRDFAEVLGYISYQHFMVVINKAKLACFNSGHKVENHFNDAVNMVKIGSGAERRVKTVRMSRYACYLAIQNADPRKEIVAQGQMYFAIQTRRQELSDQEQLLEDERRLDLRDQLRHHNIKLADAAKDAGVVEPIDYAIFQNHGYRGLYNGLE
jgi:DNA-damage-inducible protein D